MQVAYLWCVRCATCICKWFKQRQHIYLQSKESSLSCNGYSGDQEIPCPYTLRDSEPSLQIPATGP